MVGRKSRRPADQVYVIMTAVALDHDQWVEQARAVHIEDELARRGIKLNGKVDKVERAGPCPRCGGDDRFSINTKKQVFNCRQCGGRGDVIDLVRWLDGVEFIEACTTLAGPSPAINGKGAAAPPRKTLVGKWTYCDESGTVLLKVGRFEYQNPDGSFVLKDGKRKKKFEQKRPDPDHPGKWINNADGVRVVPYKLPELIEAIANGHSIAIVEGEAKADLLWSWNVPATCNVGGAKHWKPEHAAFLKDADVVLVPDNDAVGWEHMNIVGQSLQGIAKSVRVLELPGLGPKQDIVDWAKQGGTVEQLYDLSEREAKPWAPRAKPEQQAANEEIKKPAEQTPKELPRLPFLDMSRWDQDQPPKREWALHERIPLMQASLFSGEGGGGKSNSWLQECYAHAIGRDWLGMFPEPGGAWFVECEDDEKELHRRARCIADYYQTPISEAVKGGLRLISFAGHDAVLATMSKSGKIEPTPLYKAFLEEAGDIKPKMIGIASSANVFAGKENDRNQVQQFVGMLTRIAMAANGAVSLISHPSLTGINTESGLSGTTQWHNAVRARFYMRGVNPEPGEQPDSDLRELVFKKNNYGPIAHSIVLRYQRGLFLPVQGISSLDRAASEQLADDVFLDLLKRFTKANRNVSDRAGPGYAPAQFAREDEAKRTGLNSKSLEAAMRRLFKTEKIENQPYGRPSRPNHRIALKT
jgi:RecA-family ATPase